MKLGEALSQLKKEQNRLTRLISLRKENIYVEQGKKTKIDPKRLSEEIDNKIKEIRELKIKIQNTNLNTRINDKNLTLAEAIIKINDLRDKISNLSKLFDKEREYLFRDKDMKDRIAQLDEQEIEKEIVELENEKTQLDNKIQITNWTTELID